LIPAVILAFDCDWLFFRIVDKSHLRENPEGIEHRYIVARSADMLPGDSQQQPSSVAVKLCGIACPSGINQNIGGIFPE
jgi:hypothetical protein